MEDSSPVISDGVLNSLNNGVLTGTEKERFIEEYDSLRVKHGDLKVLNHLSKNFNNDVINTEKSELMITDSHFSGVSDNFSKILANESSCELNTDIKVTRVGNNFNKGDFGPITSSFAVNREYLFIGTYSGVVIVKSFTSEDFTQLKAFEDFNPVVIMSAYKESQVTSYKETFMQEDSEKYYKPEVSLSNKKSFNILKLQENILIKSCRRLLVLHKDDTVVLWNYKNGLLLSTLKLNGLKQFMVNRRDSYLYSDVNGCIKIVKPSHVLKNLNTRIVHTSNVKLLNMDLLVYPKRFYVENYTLTNLLAVSALNKVSIYEDGRYSEAIFENELEYMGEDFNTSFMLKWAIYSDKLLLLGCSMRENLYILTFLRENKLCLQCGRRFAMPYLQSFTWTDELGLLFIDECEFIQLFQPATNEFKKLFSALQIKITPENCSWKSETEIQPVDYVGFNEYYVTGLDGVYEIKLKRNIELFENFKYTDEMKALNYLTKHYKNFKDMSEPEESIHLCMEIEDKFRICIMNYLKKNLSVSTMDSKRQGYYYQYFMEIALNTLYTAGNLMLMNTSKNVVFNECYKMFSTTDMKSAFLDSLMQLVFNKKYIDFPKNIILDISDHCTSRAKISEFENFVLNLPDMDSRIVNSILSTLLNQRSYTGYLRISNWCKDLFYEPLKKLFDTYVELYIEKPSPTEDLYKDELLESLLTNIIENMNSITKGYSANKMFKETCDLLLEKTEISCRKSNYLYLNLILEFGFDKFMKNLSIIFLDSVRVMNKDEQKVIMKYRYKMFNSILIVLMSNEKFEERHISQYYLILAKQICQSSKCVETFMNYHDGILNYLAIPNMDQKSEREDILFKLCRMGYFTNLLIQPIISICSSEKRESLAVKLMERDFLDANYSFLTFSTPIYVLSHFYDDQKTIILDKTFHFVNLMKSCKFYQVVLYVLENCHDFWSYLKVLLREFTFDNSHEKERFIYTRMFELISSTHIRFHDGVHYLKNAIYSYTNELMNLNERLFIRFCAAIFPDLIQPIVNSVCGAKGLKGMILKEIFDMWCCDTRKLKPQKYDDLVSTYFWFDIEKNLSDLNILQRQFIYDLIYSQSSRLSEYLILMPNIFDLYSISNLLEENGFLHEAGRLHLRYKNVKCCVELYMKNILTKVQSFTDNVSRFNMAQFTILKEMYDEITFLFYNYPSSFDDSERNEICLSLLEEFFRLNKQLMESKDCTFTEEYNGLCGKLFDDCVKNSSIIEVVQIIIEKPDLFMNLPEKVRSAFNLLSVHQEINLMKNKCSLEIINVEMLSNVSFMLSIKNVGAWNDKNTCVKCTEVIEPDRDYMLFSGCKHLAHVKCCLSKIVNHESIYMCPVCEKSPFNMNEGRTLFSSSNIDDKKVFNIDEKPNDILEKFNINYSETTKLYSKILN